MPKIRLQGAATRVVRITSDSAPQEITVTFTEGEDLPDGELYATATSRGEQIMLDVADMTGSDGQVVVVATVDPYDFEAYGRRVWAVEVGTFDDVSGSDSDTSYVMFTGTVVFEQVIPTVIESTVIEEAAS